MPRFYESKIQAVAMYRKNTVQEAFPDSKGEPPSMAGGVFLEIKKVFIRGFFILLKNVSDFKEKFL